MHPDPFLFRCDGRVVGLRRRVPDEDDGVLAAVNRFALRPLGVEDFAVFTLDLCHNQIDKHFSRFPDAEIEKIAALVPGRPLMERHDIRGALPRGTFFRARLHREGERISVRPDVYVLRTQENEDLIRNIEGGIYRETSIGFAFARPECSVCGADIRACPHEPGRSYDGHTCHYLLRDVLEVIEGSIVASGSQGTQFVSSNPSDALAAARAGVWKHAAFLAITPWTEE